MGPDRDGQGPRGARRPGRRSGRRAGYDVRWLFRTILNTQGLPARGPLDLHRLGPDPVRLELPEPAPRRPDPRLARRRPSNLPVDGPAAAAAGHGQGGGQEGGLAADLKGAVAKQGGGAAAATRGTCSTPSSASTPRPRTTTSSGTIPQALFLMNSPQINRAIEARPGTVLGEILDDHARQPRGPRTPSTSASSPASRPPRRSQTCGRYLDDRRRPQRGVRGHPLEPDQLDRVHHPSLTRPRPRRRPTRRRPTPASREGRDGHDRRRRSSRWR